MLYDLIVSPIKYEKMKKTVFLLLAIGFIMACSSNDDSNDPQQQTPNDVGEYSLILNGAGYTEQRVELFNDTINFVGAGVLYAASDNFNNAIGVIASGEEGTTTILEYPDDAMHPSGFEPNTASFFIGNDVYRSENGSFTLEAFEFDGENCGIWRGNLNINFTLDGDGGDVLNVSGTYEVFSSGCDTDN